MMIDGLRILSGSGFAIHDYRYTGFGSIHFVDFVMVHKLLGMLKMTSVEYSREIEKRVEFNKPYDCVDIVMGPISDLIPELSQDERHVLWLDYDDVVSAAQLEDVWAAAARLSVGSILIVTVDVEPPLRAGGPKEWKKYYESVADTYLGRRPPSSYARSKLPQLNAEIISRAIQSGLSGRMQVELIPIFNFLYADGHAMLTVGCVIGTEAERRQVLNSTLSEQNYYRGDFADAPYKINIPIVTRRERAYLDKAMPCRDGWSPSGFELQQSQVDLYREIYRFLPAYAELLL
jgi:hypothetical protein